MLEVFDALSRYHPGVELHCYVGDVDLFCARRAPEDAADVLAAAARRLLDLFERALRPKVAYHKCVVLSSCSKVEARLHHKLQDIDIRLEAWRKKLGVQFSLQQRRRFGLLRQRASVARGRARRVGSLRVRRGAQARARLHRAGVLPVSTYGDSYCGFEPSAIT